MNHKIAVLIPCYNESKTIEKCIKDWKHELPEAIIYVYDNNSTDHTDEIARDAARAVNTAGLIIFFIKFIVPSI